MLYRFFKETQHRILMGLILIGTALRLYHLGFNSFWLDEIATIRFSTGSFYDIWMYTINGEFNPPLFYWIEKIIIDTVGISEFTMRIIPAIVGIMTIPIFYLIGKELVNKNIGVISAALITFSTFHIYYSQEARAYTLVLFFFSLGLLIYIYALNYNKIWQWITFPICFALAFWSHFYVFVGIAAVFLHLFYLMYKTNKIDFRSPIVFTIAILPLILVSLDLFSARQSMGVSWGADWKSVIYHFFLQNSGYNVAFIGIFIILLISGIYNLYKRYPDKAFFITLGLTSGLIIIIPLTFIFNTSVRYLIYLLPFYLVAIACSTIPIFEKRNIPITKLIFAIILCIIFINSSSATVLYTETIKPDYHSAVIFLNENIEPGDYIITIPESRLEVFNFYYNNSEIKIDTLQKDNITELEEKISDDGHYWFVIIKCENEYSIGSPVKEWLDKRYISRKEFSYIEIYEINTGEIINE